MKQTLQEYIKKSMHSHAGYAGVQLMMNYYVFYELISEGINPYIESARDNHEQLLEIVGRVFDEEQPLASMNEAAREELCRSLGALRQEVTDKMQVLSTYVDQFVLYEYVLNRVQYRFETPEEMPDDAAFAQQLVNFIFSTKDNMAINDHIHMAIGQLPVRMTRSRFYDVIRDSISVYKGSDRSSLDSFLYMFRTNAMLYRAEGMDRYFTEFAPVIEELGSLDYEHITKELYDIYAEKIRVCASRLNDISDLYMLLAQLINGVYSLVLTGGHLADAPKIPGMGQMIRGIHRLFVEEPEDAQEQLEELAQYFPGIEGMQEQFYEGMTMMDAVLEETSDAQADEIEKQGLAGEFRKLQDLQVLSSGSHFAPLQEEADDTKVTSQDTEEVAAALIDELKASFKTKSRMLRRAIMANTLDKMPVFFTTPQEVADYISMSLQMCDDEAEKTAAKQLLTDLMQD